MGRNEGWQYDLRIVIEAIERNIERQESFNESVAHMPESLQNSEQGDCYNQIVEVDLGSVLKALVELYQAKAIEK
jgi:hypothetical protein